MNSAFLAHLLSVRKTAFTFEPTHDIFLPFFHFLWFTLCFKPKQPSYLFSPLAANPKSEQKYASFCWYNLGPYHLHGHELWCHLTLALISDEKVMQRRRGWALLFQMMYITSDTFSFFLKTQWPFLVLKIFCPNLLST